MKKTYRDFDREIIGGSDIAALTLTGCTPDGVDCKMLKFGGDAAYKAYIVDDADVEIGEHYTLVATFKSWVRIYDDYGMSWEYSKNDATINIYRAGDYGCIIQIVEG